jgi:hypothetical protein
MGSMCCPSCGKKLPVRLLFWSPLWKTEVCKHCNTAFKRVSHPKADALGVMIAYMLFIIPQQIYLNTLASNLDKWARIERTLIFDIPFVVLVFVFICIYSYKKTEYKIVQ